MGSSSIPTTVPGLAPGATSVAAGGDTSCAILKTGAVRCWGSNDDGQLGDGSTQGRLGTLTDIAGLSPGIEAVAVGSGYACALLSDGSIKCWGDNGAGQLGNGTTTDSRVPVAVLGLGGPASVLSVGRHHSCAVVAGGGIKCWGGNFSGEVGDGSLQNASSAKAVLGLSDTAVAVSAGAYHSCAALTSGVVQCWGENYSGQLGNGTTTDSLAPVTVASLESKAVAVSASDEHTCALLDTRTVQCWGDNYAGELGDGTRSSSTMPVAVVGLSDNVVAIATASSDTCALLETGGIMCWGYAFYGETGNGSALGAATWQPSAQAVVGLTSGVRGIVGGSEHFCAVLESGWVKCWGVDSKGQASALFPGWPHAMCR
jgi:alpha-tubulin suppressor-like RCC1 family protein